MKMEKNGSCLNGLYRKIDQIMKLVQCSLIQKNPFLAMEI